MLKPAFRPLGIHILVKPSEEKDTTESGIILPDTVTKEEPQEGEIVALGTEEITSDLKIGATIIFKKFAPDEIEIDDELFFIMTEEDILGIIV
jgi:chaperonin GroES